MPWPVQMATENSISSRWRFTNGFKTCFEQSQRILVGFKASALYPEVLNALRMNYRWILTT